MQELVLSNSGNWAWAAGAGPKCQGLALSKDENGKARECSRKLDLQLEGEEIPEGGIRLKTVVQIEGTWHFSTDRLKPMIMLSVSF